MKRWHACGLFSRRGAKKRHGRAVTQATRVCHVIPPSTLVIHFRLPFARQLVTPTPSLLMIYEYEAGNRLRFPTGPCTQLPDRITSRIFIPIVQIHHLQKLTSLRHHKSIMHKNTAKPECSEEIGEDERGFRERKQGCNFQHRDPRKRT